MVKLIDSFIHDMGLSFGSLVYLLKLEQLRC